MQVFYSLISSLKTYCRTLQSDIPKVIFLVVATYTKFVSNIRHVIRIYIEYISHNRASSGIQDHANSHAPHPNESLLNYGHPMYGMPIIQKWLLVKVEFKTSTIEWRLRQDPVTTDDTTTVNIGLRYAIVFTVTIIWPSLKLISNPIASTLNVIANLRWPISGNYFLNISLILWFFSDKIKVLKHGSFHISCKHMAFNSNNK